MSRFTIPKLDYKYNALEPFIDTKTMETHHQKHHATYVLNLNNSTNSNNSNNSTNSDYSNFSLRKLCDSEITQIKNSAGGHYNHSFFFFILGKKGKMSQGLEKTIIEKYGSFLIMQEKFNKAALSVFGSGYAWITLPSLEISTTKNQDVAYGVPLIGIDVWEHAYYLKYLNLRGEFINSFWEVVDWDKINWIFDNFKDKNVLEIEDDGAIMNYTCNKNN